MTAHRADDADMPELDIVTEHGIVTRLPTSFPLLDPERDADLDPDRFQQGFDDALADLDRMPPRWARHYATSILDKPAPRHDSDRSHTRGYRAGLYGFVHHSPL
ncbi:hypothetical protein [Gordonia hydrophobica]|uniref:Uncharacterized protein n=1 Tax=Gordonia hydrophobica TaxID=40516 RepID=A0ABZ2TYZ9_9ACTN|nr:hypothetical protein [Gordonia hydrophobica]MBM7369444.1 hypothetical protein [Gordonia hydrophobica]